MALVIAFCLALATFLLPVLSQSTSCAMTLTPTNNVKPSVASGYAWRLVATGLSSPRSIEFDRAGNLLVVEQTSGNGSICALALLDNGGTCITATSKTTLVTQALNHGLALSNDGKTLYASSSESVWSWSYDETKKAVSNQQLLITNMTTDDHTTRTLLLSQEAPGLLLVSRGSTANIDLTAASLVSGHSQIRAFNLSNLTGPYQFDTEGFRLGWGLRNSVGVAEHPASGKIYSVENSADQILRDGQDIHENNPGEEMNFHGSLGPNPLIQQGQNYGYPYCFTTWNKTGVPDNGNLTTGSPMSIDGPEPLDNSTAKNDAYCDDNTIPPRLTFQAHMAPLDIVFNNSGTEGWVTFHGSWDRTGPVGYKMSMMAFDSSGDPVDQSDSTTAATDIFYNVDNSVCPGSCFRPVGMAIDQDGRIFVSSDATGEIYVVMKEGTPTPTNITSGSGSGSSPNSASSSSSSTSGGATPSTSSSASNQCLPGAGWMTWLSIGLCYFAQLHA